MEALATVARFELIFFVGAVALVIGYKMLAGQIVLTGLLADHTTLKFSTARLQMLIATLVAAAAFLSQVIANPMALPSGDNFFDKENLTWAALLASHSGYLGAKFHSHKLPKLNPGAAGPGGGNTR